MSDTAKTTRIHLLGDINLLGVDDAAVPFAKVAPTLKAADAVFSNLECNLYDPAETRSMMRDDQSGFEGFYAPPAAGEALRLAGVQVIQVLNARDYLQQQLESHSQDAATALGGAATDTARTEELVHEATKAVERLLRT